MESPSSRRRERRRRTRRLRPPHLRGLLRHLHHRHIPLRRHRPLLRRRTFRRLPPRRMFRRRRQHHRHIPLRRLPRRQRRRLRHRSLRPGPPCSSRSGKESWRWRGQESGRKWHRLLGRLPAEPRRRRLPRAHPRRHRTPGRHRSPLRRAPLPPLLHRARAHHSRHRAPGRHRSPLLRAPLRLRLVAGRPRCRPEPRRWSVTRRQRFPRRFQRRRRRPRL
jgi:hypothetical protein